MTWGRFLPKNFPAIPPLFCSFDFELFLTGTWEMGDSLPFLPVGGVAEVREPFGEGGGIDN